MASGPCPSPPTCVEHFDLLLCLSQPSSQSDLCFLQPPARDGHQRRASVTAAMPKLQPPKGAWRALRCVPSSTPSLGDAGERPAGGCQDVFEPCYALMLRGVLPQV